MASTEVTLMDEPTRSAPPRTARRAALPRAVWLVSWTSFFTDTASEIVYPLMPLYLTRVLGATAISIGIIEGAAEGLNSILKIVSGRLADRFRARKGLMIAGYALSSAVRPLVALATSWPQVLGVRLADRVGKGIRSAPRDALVASWVAPEVRGYAFGVNRAMDHAGAVAGPLLATLFLWLFPGQYRFLFALTLIPGIAAVAMLLPVPDAVPDRMAADSADAAQPARQSGALSGSFLRYLGVLVVFSLGNSTDAFLLLRLSDAGIGITWIPLTWAALHVVKAAASPLAGSVSDRVSRKAVITAGWVVYAGVYAAFAWAKSLPALLGVFMAYGLYYGLTEGVEKAVVADIAPADALGLAFGAYNAVIGVGALLASLMFGVIWKLFGAPAAFLTGAGLAIVAAALLSRLDLSQRPLSQL